MVHQGHAAVVQLLLDVNTAVDAIGAEGPTALHCAASNGHGTAVQLLLDAKTSVNAVYVRQLTALPKAANMGHTARRCAPAARCRGSSGCL